MKSENNGTATSENNKVDEPKRVACMGCRTIKVRCLQGPPGNGETCTRCIRLKLECVYVPRGSKIRRAMAPDMTVTAGRGATSSNQGSTDASTSTSTNVGTNPLSPHTFSLPPPPAQHQHQRHVHIVSPHAPSSPSTIQFKHSPGQLSTTTSSSGPEHGTVGGGARDPNHAVRSLLEAAEAAEARSSIDNPSRTQGGLVLERHGFPVAAARPRVEYPDPFELGILTRGEGEQLLRMFHEVLNPYIIIFDPKLHTLDFLLSTSTVLLTSVLAVSSKFYRPDLYPTLLGQAQLLVTRAWSDALSELGFVQALMCLVYWKEPTDSSSWLRIGYAIRLGYQLRLHHPRTTPLPDDDQEARMILDRERTFILMNCFDAAYRLYGDKDPTNQTSMTKITEVNAPKWWAENEQFLTPEDRQFGYSVSNCKLHSLIRTMDALASSGSTSLAALLQLYPGTTRHNHAHLQD
ncbi:hypothetical protein T439DRAFT_146362 [Meredithblackwellia eburnea MCA 4105]